MKRIAVGDDKNASTGDARDVVLPPPLLLQSLKTHKDDGDSHLLVFNIDALISKANRILLMIHIPVCFQWVYWPKNNRQLSVVVLPMNRRLSNESAPAPIHLHRYRVCCHVRLQRKSHQR
jgi:hypothetical protein